MKLIHSLVIVTTLAVAFSLQIAHADPFPSSPEQVCHDMGNSAQLIWLPQYQQLVDTGMAEEMYDIDFSPWTLSMSTKLQARRAAFSIQLKHALALAFRGDHGDLPVPTPSAAPNPADPTPSPSIPDFHELKEYLNYFVDHPRTYPSTVSQTVTNAFAGMEVDTRTSDLSKAADVFCAHYLMLSCPSALRRALKIMEPRQGNRAWISLVEETKELMTDPMYIAPLSRAALKVWKRIQDAEAGANVEGDVFHDLIQAFGESGFSQKESEERAWKVLGVYSTRGASMDGFSGESIRTSENTPVVIPLFVISAGMNYLDVLNKSPDRFYSFPSPVKSQCKAGKPYHFWNAAYIAHRLINERYSPKASALAMHMAGMFYDMYSNTLGRNPYQVYREDLYSVHDNGLRIDVLLHALGGAFAAQPNATLLDGDLNFNELAKAARQVPPLTDQEISDLSDKPFKHYDLWNKIISPDTSFYQLWK